MLEDSSTGQPAPHLHIVVKRVERNGRLSLVTVLRPLIQGCGGFGS